jgi:hypothetical protein
LVIAQTIPHKPTKAAPPPNAAQPPAITLPQGIPPLLRAVPLPEPPVPQRPLLYGVNVVWGENGSNVGWDRSNGAYARRLVTLMKAAGVTNTRVEIGWADVERTRGHYDWRPADRFLRFVKAQGFVLTCVVDKTPDWANDPNPAVGKLFADRGVAEQHSEMAPASPYYADLGRFAYQLGKRYKDIIHRWEFWNEPDGDGMPMVVRDLAGHPQDIRYGGDAGLYAKLLRIFSANIKRADSNSLVAVGGLATPRTDFLQALYTGGTRNAFDAVALHPLTFDSPLLVRNERPGEGPGVRSHPLAFDWIDACHQVLLAHGDARKKLWLTQWGWSTYPGEPGGIVEGEQAHLVRSSLAAMRNRDFIELASFATLNDWRAQEDDPLSLVSTGLCTRDLNARPAYADFQAEAHSLPPSDSGQNHRVALVAAWPDNAQAAANLDVDAGRIVGALPQIARAIVPEIEKTAALPAAWLDFAPRFKAAGITLVRVAPFRAPGAVTQSANGAPSVRWETADAALRAVAQAGESAVLELTPPLSMSPTTWSAFVTQAMRRYGSDPQYGVARWELGGSADEAQRWYAPFAQAVRAGLPTTPVGFRLADGDPVEGAKALAVLCAAQNIPCDSLAWRAADSPTEAAQTLRRIRAVLAGVPALKALTLWPLLSVGDSDPTEASRCIAAAVRLADYSPLSQPDSLGGVAFVASDALLRPGRSAALWNALTLLNRVSGARLRADSDDSNVRCVAARTPNGTLQVLVWREGGDPGTLRTALRLHGLARTAPGGLRMEQFLVDAAHSSGLYALADATRTAAAQEQAEQGTLLERVALADLSLENGADTMELPLVLGPNTVTLLQMRPRRPVPVQITLSVPRFTYLSGEEFPLTVTLHNASKMPQHADVQLVGSEEGLVPPVFFRTSAGMVPPGATRALRYRLRAPRVAQDTLAFLNVLVGTESRSALTLQLTSPLLATLDTPRVDLNAPSARATVRVRLINRGATPLNLTLHAGGSASRPPRASDPGDFFEVAGGGKPVVREVAVTAPASDPGNYPLAITVADKFTTLATLQALVGVPVLCHYAAQMPLIDGNLQEWTDADPMGMGRPEQVHDKVWRGPSDLSAIAYTKWDDRFFYFACSVTDDVPFQPFPAPEMWRGDSVQFALSTDRSVSPDHPGYGPGDHEIGLALLNLTQPVLYRFAGPPGVPLGPIPHSVVAVRRDGSHVYYEAAIPWSELAPAVPKPGAVYGISVVVNDNDGQGRGYIEWGGGMAPARRPGQFPPLRLVR